MQVSFELDTASQEKLLGNIQSYTVFCKICLVWLMLWLGSSTTYAQEVLPPGCKAYAIHGDSIKFSAKTTAKVFMLHNLSAGDIWLVSPQLSTQLAKGRWSALTLDDAPIELQCVESRPGHEQQISCSNVFAVCQWPAAKNPNNAPSTAFVGENMQLSALIAYLGRQGFELLPSDE